jgi:hypothetical protein
MKSRYLRPDQSSNAHDLLIRERDADLLVQVRRPCLFQLCHKLDVEFETGDFVCHVEHFGIPLRRRFENSEV